MIGTNITPNTATPIIEGGVQFQKIGHSRNTEMRLSRARQAASVPLFRLFSRPYSCAVLIFGKDVVDLACRGARLALCGKEGGAVDLSEGVVVEPCGKARRTRDILVIWVPSRDRLEVSARAAYSELAAGADGGVRSSRMMISVGRRLRSISDCISCSCRARCLPSIKPLIAPCMAWL